jgi:integrase/recombinase XerD
MTSLHDGLADYLRIRRGEGAKFKRIGVALEHFVEFLVERGAERVTVELAVEWATLPTRASDMHRANRLTMVRGFAAYLRERDPANEIPPWGLLPSGQAEKPDRHEVDHSTRLLLVSAPRWLTISGSGAHSATN